jgi:hypothetical protein
MFLTEETSVVQELVNAETASTTLLCEQLGLTGVLKEHYLSLCIVPNDTPLPMTMLARLWRTTEEDAEASANLLEQSVSCPPPFTHPV